MNTEHQPTSSPGRSSVKALWIPLLGASVLVLMLSLGLLWFVASAKRDVPLATDLPGIPERINGHLVDIEIGQALYMQSCASCHGKTGEGMAMQGSPLVRSHFLTQNTDSQVVRFLQRGRNANDPASLTQRAMPARGGNPNLTDQDLADITAYLRAMQHNARNTPTPTPGPAPSSDQANSAP